MLTPDLPTKALPGSKITFGISKPLTSQAFFTASPIVFA